MFYVNIEYLSRFYQAKFKKSYNSVEDAQRKKVFAARLALIVANNKNSSSPYQMAINQFTDVVYT